MSRTNSNVLTAATVAVTNITGLRHSWRGSSLTKDWPTAAPISAGSYTGLERVCLRDMHVTPQENPASERLAGHHQPVLDDRAERQCLDVGQDADPQDGVGAQTRAHTGQARQSPARP